MTSALPATPLRTSGRALGRHHREALPRQPHVEAQTSQHRRHLVGRDRHAEHSFDVARRELDRGRRRHVSRDVEGVARATPSPDSSREVSGRTAPRRAGTSWGSTPRSNRFDPSVRSACRLELRAMAMGSKYADSSNTSVVASLISLAAPPMMPGESEHLVVAVDDDAVLAGVAQTPSGHRQLAQRRRRASRASRRVGPVAPRSVRPATCAAS